MQVGEGSALPPTGARRAPYCWRFPVRRQAQPCADQRPERPGSLRSKREDWAARASGSKPVTGIAGASLNFVYLGIPLTQVAQHIVSRRKMVRATIEAHFVACVAGATAALTRPAKDPVATERITMTNRVVWSRQDPRCPSHQNHHIYENLSQGDTQIEQYRSSEGKYWNALGRARAGSPR